jgi:23S rRNA G2445 N2-methylase RlmL
VGVGTVGAVEGGDGAGCEPITFRVSCKRSGDHYRRFEPGAIAEAVATLLAYRTGWKSNVRASTLEVYVHINDTEVVVGIPIVRATLAERPYLSYPGMRATVAYCMASRANLYGARFRQKFTLEDAIGFSRLFA